MLWRSRTMLLLFNNHITSFHNLLYNNSVLLAPNSCSSVHFQWVWTAKSFIYSQLTLQKGWGRLATTGVSGRDGINARWEVPQGIVSKTLWLPLRLMVGLRSLVVYELDRVKVWRPNSSAAVLCNISEHLVSEKQQPVFVGIIFWLETKL